MEMANGRSEVDKKVALMSYHKSYSIMCKAERVKGCSGPCSCQLRPIWNRAKEMHARLDPSCHWSAPTRPSSLLYSNKSQHYYSCSMRCTKSSSFSKFIVLIIFFCSLGYHMDHCCSSRNIVKLFSGAANAWGMLSGAAWSVWRASVLFTHSFTFKVLN